MSNITVKETKEITSGAGLWSYEEWNEQSEYNAMTDVGMVKDSQLTAERTWDIVLDGDPQVEVKRNCNGEKGTWECVLGEDIPEEKALKLGAGTLSNYAKQENVHKVLTKTLFGNNWESLGVSYKANSSLTKSDFVVQGPDGTPPPWAESNFEIGKKEGMLAIKRSANSKIPLVGNRATVQVIFDCTIPGGKKFVFGGTSQTKTFFFQHTKETDDGDLKILKMRKVAPPGKEEDIYPSGKSSQGTKVAFGLQPDPNFNPGEQLYEKNWEDSLAA